MVQETKSPAEKRTFNLQPDQSRYIDSLVEAGVFASESEVVEAGLRALQACDDAMERWLREEAVPVYDQMKADPGCGVPLAEAREHLRQKHAQRLQDEAR